MAISDYVIGHIRTWTPMAVGFLVTYLTDNLGIVVEDSQVLLLTSGLTALVSAVYYGLVRLIAQKVPQAGILLGYNKKPAYYQAENLGTPPAPPPPGPVEGE